MGIREVDEIRWNFAWLSRSTASDGVDGTCKVGRECTWKWNMKLEPHMESFR
jgi:hypothetical protein